ncbi:hypothetical protein [Hyalangium rubrum]|uniref:Lipoprotein n=1 Tax=Hyalangium rubrum TaxID=3103134 RepID=A0ABU5GX52_9BACT|nr:hypothetical protein [Hyalangium sp. s54d21]MDY7225768.1 hypothetical protein [Hyalangium sp. s54d21]
MGRRWAWMGMVGVCALLSGCKEREQQEQPAAPVAARAPAPARPNVGTAPERTTAAPPAGTPAQPQMTPAQPMAQTPAAAPRGTGSTTSPGTAPGAPNAPMVVTEMGAPEQAPEGRVMIGFEAVQAREDEAWHEGAAKAARAAQQNDSVPLEKVVIATGTVDGRVSRVDKGTVHVRDGEGNVYQLRIDKKSRSLRQGQALPLRQLEEGTPVRASFDLVGEDSYARDIEVRR